ncbi:hypothetical protein CCACVL1_19068 [Corchorus capsularis]|uniref:Uncharacterized protein n=1 Tax=Corchorus capsularis TaxID=210143 RepID=A0A1R3HIM7_COCAP|nr:hypothetical protein CCACVL1_19068 [Corchorus capsularis]
MATEYSVSTILKLSKVENKYEDRVLIEALQVLIMCFFEDCCRTFIDKREVDGEDRRHSHQYRYKGPLNPKG